MGGVWMWWKSRSKKRISMGRIASGHADKVILTSDNPRREDPLSICSDILEGWLDSNHAHVEIDRKKRLDMR